MGFQDRDYNRYDPYDDNGYHRRRGRSGPMSMTMRIIILNFVLWITNGLLFPNTIQNLMSPFGTLTNCLRLHAGVLFQPQLWWQFLTSGFVHSPISFMHIAGNMFALVMFGYGMMLGIGPGGFGLFRGENVEDRLGRNEFLAFYLLTIILGSLTFATVNPESSALGASGGVTGVVILFAFFYPHKTLLFMFIIPMPMWVIGVIIVFFDAYGAAGYGCGGIAYTVHLAGAAFAVFYYYVFYKKRRRIIDLFSGFGKLFQRRSNLKVYREDEKPKKEMKSAKDAEFEKKLDDILDRYGKVGESGLTPEEREFLQRASKRYRDKK